MDYLIVYSKFETAFTSLGLAVLENATGVKIQEVINGEFLLSFILPRNDPKWQHIQPENFIKVYDCSQKKDQYFRIRSFDEQRDNTGKLTSNVQCEHVYYDAHDCKYFPNVELIGQTPLQVLQYAFAGTRFTVGTVEITTPTDIITEIVYPSDIVAILVENVGGELIKDNWTIKLVSKRGSNTGVQFRYGKNQASLKKSTDAKNIITRLYPYGKNNMQISGSLGYINSPLINSYDRPRIGHINYNDIEDPAELLTEALKEWSTSNQDGIDKPRVTYSGEFVELKKLKEYGEIEAFGIGDTVRIIDEGLGIDTTQRIMEYEYYPYEPKRSKVNLSNTKPSVYKDNRPNNVIGNTISTSRYVEKITDSSNKIDPGWFQNIKTKLRTLFNGGLKDAVMHKTGDIWVDNPSNPTKAMGILADGFAIANSKLSNGDWDWKTFGTADGFFADLIVAGILRAVTVEGCNIIGSSIKTAISGLRTEMIPNGYLTEINQYDFGNKLRLKMRTNENGGSIRFYDADGNPGGSISQGSNYLYIDTGEGFGISLGSMWSNNYLYGDWNLGSGATINFGGKSGTFDSADGKTVTVSRGIITNIT